jgi:hypothetical protein
MWWLWFVGPLVMGLVYVLTGRRDRRREVEIERWQRQMDARTAPEERAWVYRSGKPSPVPVAGKPGPRRVTTMPGPLTRMLASAGGGVRIDTFELAPKLAYLAVVGADLMQGSEHQTVVAKLDEPAPSFTARPLPIVEGERVPNTGVVFKKDPDFMALFLVERGLEESAPAAAADDTSDKAIRAWLSPPLREALLDFPDGWLRVDGKAKTMAFTLYGPADADRMRELIVAADIVFAEYGAGGGPSLLGEEDSAAEDAPAAAPPPPPAKTKKPKKDASASKS